MERKQELLEQIVAMENLSHWDQQLLDQAWEEKVRELNELDDTCVYIGGGIFVSNEDLEDMNRWEEREESVYEEVFDIADEF